MPPARTPVPPSVAAEAASEGRIIPPRRRPTKYILPQSPTEWLGWFTNVGVSPTLSVIAAGIIIAGWVYVVEPSRRRDQQWFDQRTQTDHERRMKELTAEDKIIDKLTELVIKAAAMGGSR